MIGLDALQWLRSLVRNIRAACWKYSHNDFLIILNWHQITPAFDPFYHHRHVWTRLDVFQASVDYLTREFEICPLYEAIEALNRESLRGRCVALTFDDGDISLAKHVLPFLQQRGLPATFFINTAYLGGLGTYWFPILSFFSASQSMCRSPAVPEELRQQLRHTRNGVEYDAVRRRIEQFAPSIPNLASRLVSEHWLAGLDGDQFAIGAHGHEHERYSMMSQEWQRNDLTENIRRLSKFRAYRPIFAVPFGRAGDWNAATIQIAHENRLRVVLADGGINLRRGDSYLRIPGDGIAACHLVTAGMASV